MVSSLDSNEEEEAQARRVSIVSRIGEGDRVERGGVRKEGEWQDGLLVGRWGEDGGGESANVKTDTREVPLTLGVAFILYGY